MILLLRGYMKISILSVLGLERLYSFSQPLCLPLKLLISPIDPFLVIKPLISDSFHHTSLPLLSVIEFACADLDWSVGSLFLLQILISGFRGCGPNYLFIYRYKEAAE